LSLVYSIDSGRIPFGYAEFTRNRAATFTEVGAKINTVKSGLELETYQPRLVCSKSLLTKPFSYSLYAPL